MTDNESAKTEKDTRRTASMLTPSTYALMAMSAWLLGIALFPSIYGGAAAQQHLLLVFCGASGIALMLMGVFRVKLTTVLRKPAYPIAALFLMVAGTALAGFAVNETNLISIGTVAGALEAVGWTLTVFDFGSRLVGSDTALSSQRVIIGLTGGTVLASLCALLPAPICTVIVCAFALACGILLIVAGRSSAAQALTAIPDRTTDARTALYLATQSGMTVAASSGNGRQHTLLQRPSFFLKLIFALALFGFVLGTLQYYLIFSAENTGIVIISASCIVGIAISGAIGWLSLRASTKSCYSLLYRLATVALVLCCLVVLFVAQTALLRLALLDIALLCTAILTGGLLGEVTIRHSLPRVRAFGCGIGALMLGVAIGVGAGMLCGANEDLLFQNIYSLLIAGAMIVIVTFAFVFTDKDIEHFFEPRAEEADAPTTPEAHDNAKSIDERCAELAESYGLSAREVDVLGLLARGRSGTRIEQELYISRGTVNSHMRNIYQKLGVHSRQELLDLFEEEEL